MTRGLSSMCIIAAFPDEIKGRLTGTPPRIEWHSARACATFPRRYPYGET